MDVVRPCLKSPKGRYDNNPPAALAPHHSGCRLGTEKRSLQVYAQHLVPILFAELVPLAGKEDARVVDQYIEPPETSLDRPEHRRHLLGPGNVGAHGHGLAPQTLNLAHTSLCAFLRFVVMHYKIGSRARQGQRDDATYAPSCAGDQGDLVLKWTIVHHACIDITARGKVKRVCFYTGSSQAVKCLKKGAS